MTYEVSFMNGFLTFPKGSAEVDFKFLALIPVKHRSTLCEVLFRNAAHIALRCTTGLKSPLLLLMNTVMNSKIKKKEDSTYK